MDYLKAFLALFGVLLAGANLLAGGLSLLPGLVAGFGTVCGLIFVWEGTADLE